MDLKYLKNVLLFLIGGALTLLLIVYLSYHLSGGFTDEVTTYRTEGMEWEQSVELDGYLFRAEQLLYASGTGEVSYLAEDGEKLRKEAAYAQLYRESDPERSEEIRRIEEKIALLEKSNKEKDGIVYDAAAIDRQIEVLREGIREELRKGNTEYAVRKKDELLVLLNRRSIIVQSVKNYDDQIDALEKEKKDLLASFTGSGSGQTLYTPGSGTFYSNADGYETVFTPEALDALTTESFEQLIGSEPALDGDRRIIGKLATDFHWYTVASVTSSELRSFRTGDTYTVIFPYNEDIRIPMVLSRVISGIDSDRALLVFDSTVTPEGFRFMRMQSVRIVRSVEQGIRIPIGAARSQDGASGVYVLDQSTVRFRRIEVLFEEDGYLVAAPYDKNRKNAEQYLTESDLIITEGKDLYDGKVLRTS